MNKYLTIEQQMNNLKLSNKLIFVDKDSEDKFISYLENYGYHNFIKKIKHPMMFEQNEFGKSIFKPEMTSNNLRYLFDIDRNICSTIFKYLRSFEFLFNSIITIIIAKEIEKSNGTTYLGSISKSDFERIFSNSKTAIEVWETFFKYTNNDKKCKNKIISNKDSEIPKVCSTVENGWFWKQIKWSKERQWIDIFTLMNTVSFNQIKKIYELLNDKLKDEVISIFFKNKHRKSAILTTDSFNTLLILLTDFRNLISHNNYILDFRYNLTDEKLIKFFGLKLENKQLKLNDFIFIMQYMISSSKTTILDEINKMVHQKMMSNIESSNDISILLFNIIEEISGLKLYKDEYKLL